MNDREITERLADLGARSASVRARPGFRGRVLAAVAADAAAAFPIELVRSARRLAPFAVLVAALALIFATRPVAVSSVQLAAAEESLELSW